MSIKAVSGPRRGRGEFRTDLEGLRGIAVILVVANHLFAFPSGGFVGVDVFFVLSGYLITGLLLREARTTGRIDFARFYRRRMRRILPAASLVLVATVAAAYVVFRVGRAAGVLHDALWAAIFAGNWQQAVNGTDYMNAGADPSPLQHYWSLGIEEQFYLVWPLVLLGLVWLSTRVRGVKTPGARRLLMGAGLGVLVASSFAFSVWETSARPAVAYFSTFGRAWELGLGALLAVAAPLLAGLLTRTRVLLGWLGLALILAAALFLGTASVFPGPWALLPVAGSMLVIAAGHNNQDPAYHRGMYLVDNPVCRYAGRISFSLYLWHFPVILLLRPLMSDAGAAFPAVALLLMLVLSATSFRWVEEPVRRSQWLEPELRLAAWRVRQRNKKVSNRLVATLAAAGIATLLSAAMITTLAGRPAAPSQQSFPQAVDAPASPGTTAGPAAPDPQAARTAALGAALGADAWPELQPALDLFSQDGQAVKSAEWTVDGCLGGESPQLEDPMANAAHCVYGDESATHTLVVFGDSVAISYVPGIRAALAGKGWKIHVFTVAGCPVASVAQSKIGGEPFPECDAFRKWAVSEIGALSPDLVVLSEFRNDLVLSSGARGDAADAERTQGLTQTLSQVLAQGAPVLLLQAPPGGRPLAVCATRVSKPADCVDGTTPLYDRTAAIERAVAKGSARDGRPAATYLETESWFCVAGRCPAFTGSTPIYADQYHLTDAGSRQLAPVLAQAIADAIADAAGVR